MTNEINRRTAFADEHWRKYLSEQPVLISGEAAHALSYGFGVLVGQDYARTVYATHSTSETSRALMRVIDSGGRGQIINALADHEAAIVADYRTRAEAAERLNGELVAALRDAGRELIHATGHCDEWVKERYFKSADRILARIESASAKEEPTND